MSSTYVEVKTYKDKQSYDNRLKHNRRQSNLSTGNYKGEDCINIVEKFEHSDRVEQQVSQKTRTEVTNQISRLEHRFKTAKKTATKLRLREKILKLKIERDSIKDKNQLAHKSHIELIFTITDLQKSLKRSAKYGEDLKDLVNKYVQDKLPTLEIDMLAVHLDQFNPHVHINGKYSNYDSLTNDLKNSFSDSKYQYSELQEDFNNYAINHNIVKKHKIKIEKTVKGGKKDYMKLSAYKAREARALNRAKKITDTYIKKVVANNKTLLGVDTNNIVKTLQKKIVELYAKNEASTFKSSEIFEIIEANSKLVTKYNANINTLEETKSAAKFINIKNTDLTKSIEAKSKIIDTLKGDKQDLQQEVKRLKELYEPTEQSHSNIRKQ